jgi:TRAP-type transport system periplasmic protein
MHRRTLLACAAAATLGGPALMGRAQARVTLKFHTFLSPLSYVWQHMLQPWMAQVEQASGGRIRFEAYPSMQLGGSPVLLYDQLKEGVVDLAWTLPGQTPGRFPRSEVFELPFMMNHAEATSKAFWTYIHTEASDEYRDIRPIALHVHGPGVLHTQLRAIHSPDDLRGLRMRGPTRQVTKMLGYLGAVPVGMPLPQIPEALARGEIDGCAMPWEAVPAVRVHELTRWHSEITPTGTALYTTAFVLGMNLRRYQSLPPELKRIIDAHSGLEMSAFMGRTQQAGDAAGRALALARGNAVHRVDQASGQEFRRRARQVEVEWVQDLDRRGYPGRQLLLSARRLIEHHAQT